MEKFTMTKTETTVLGAAAPFWAQPFSAALLATMPVSTCIERVRGAVAELAQAFVAAADAAANAAAHGTAVIDRAKRALEGSPHLSLATS